MADENNSMNDLSKEDLFRLLACLQSELEAREEVLKILKHERLSGADFRAKYGVSGCLSGDSLNSMDPFQALQRDSFVMPVASLDGENALKNLYDSQLIQLEHLITSQKHAQTKMKEHLLSMEQKYRKTCGELEEQRKKHEHDAAQGDDVLVLLEKERGRLKSEVEYCRSQNKRMEKELKRVLLSWKEQRVLIAKQRQAAVIILKDRRRLLTQISRDQKRIAELEKAVAGHADTLHTESNASNQIEDLSKISENVGLDSVTGECEKLRNSLKEEICSRLLLQKNFDRLQRAYDKLVAESHPTASAVLPTNSTLDSTSYSCNECPEDSSSNVLRQKPDPPIRRSSEISTMAIIPSPPGTSSSLTVSQTNGPTHFKISCEDHSFISSQSDISTTDVPSNIDPLTVKVSQSEPRTSPKMSSGSRSSTPSPPPPPPPIQLHYPYPGMQNYLQHSQTRNSGHPPYLTSTASRPVSVSPTHTGALHAAKVRAASSAFPSHQTATQQTSHPTSPSVHSGGRSHQPSIAITRGLLSRKPVTLNTPLNPHSSSHSVHFHHPYPTAFASGQQKPSSSAPGLCPQRGSIIVPPGPHPTNNHHFPLYYAGRLHQTSTSTGNTSLRSSRSSASPSSGSLAGGNASVGAEHMCINGK